VSNTRECELIEDYVNALNIFKLHCDNYIYPIRRAWLFSSA